jgi:hypothetical protein
LSLSSNLEVRSALDANCCELKRSESESDFLVGI